jgi:uncharacterized repeat protein (TIGR01451 family)
MSNYHRQASRNSARTQGKSRKYINYLARSLVLLGLIAGGSPLELLPVFAAPTAPNVTIDNQATGTFADLDDTSTGTQSVVSNTVSVTVAEVAGITIVSNNSPSAVVGGVADFDFKIKNIGNDPTKFFLPSTLSASTIVGGTQSGVLQIIGYVPAGSTTVATLASPIDVTTAGDTDSFGGGTLGGNTTLGSIPADAAIIVRVKVTVTTLVGSPVSVVLGNTPVVGDSNIPYTAGTNDVYTVDHPVGSTASGEAAGTPINGEREASATQSVNAVLTGSDYGDAPDTYKTLAASGGPSHTLSSLYLGAGVTAEGDGQPNATATGDSNDDGVTFSPIYGANYSTLVQAGINNQVTVVSSGAGYVNAWLDYNENGVFDAGEQILTNQPVVAGNNTLNFTVANTVLHGATFARFRLSPTSITTPSPIGAITGGEVEDYQVYVANAIPDGANCATTGLINGSFETPTQGAASSIQKLETIIPGWNTNASDGLIEIWSSNFLSVPSYAGNQFAEINATQVAALFQDIATVPGSTLTYQFAHRARSNDGSVVVDSTRVQAGTPGATTQLGVYSTDSTDWVLYRGTYVVPAGQYITRFEFNSIAAGSGFPSVGNFIDAVQFSTDTCITPISPPTIDLDGNNSTATGNNYQNTFTMGGAPVAAADTDVAITDDKTNITRATIQLTNPLDGATESLTLDTALATSLGISVDVAYNSTAGTSTTGRLTLKGSATLAKYQQVLATLKYGNTKASPTMTPRTINVQVIDSDKMISNTAVATIKIILAKPNLLLVKRITSIAGIPQVGTTADNTNSDFPSGYLQGSTTTGKVQSGDEVEYTIYYVNKGGSGAKSVRICDLLEANLAFSPDGFTAGHGMQLQLGNDPAQLSTLTSINDSVDRAQYLSGAPPITLTGCNFLNTSNPAIASGTVVLDLTSASATDLSIPANLLSIPGATGVPMPNNSYGFFKFKAKVK